jgi:5'-nucleotidase
VVSAGDNIGASPLGSGLFHDEPTIDNAGPLGSRVDPSTIKLNDTPIDPAASYRVTVNSFLADGGDGFTILRSGTDRLGGAIDIDALADYLTAHEPTSPTPLDRITRLN